MGLERERIDETLDRLATYRFRSSFSLRQVERRIVAVRGLGVVRVHAAEIVAQRLAPARPENDGKQTPWGGHPVFRAQHGTGTCCRGCLHRLHGIPQGRALTAEEQDLVVTLIMGWIARELARGPVAPPPDVRRSRPAAPGRPTLF